MRKLLSLLTVLLLCTALATAQTSPVTGQVRDEKGAPVPFATVKVKGSTSGVSADQNGNFKIDVKPGDVLVVSAASFEGSEITVGSGSTVNVALKSTSLLNEVVVTALGIKRAKNTLPYAAQQITGDDVTKVRPSNVASALSGKISGLQIQQGNGVGTSTNIVIRGAKSLTGNNQALFVVDGVPVDNTTNNAPSTNRNTSGSNSGKGGADQSTGRGGYDYGNAAADINPDDIESVNVLKGAAASALYGSRAANGVIMITTKKASRGLGITINSAVTVGKIDKTTFAKYQNEYGAGYSSSYQKDGFFYFDVNGDGVKDLVSPTSEDASYGVKFDPSLMVYQWDAFDPTSPNYKKATPWVAAAHTPVDFYETAVSTNNNIMLSGSNDKGSFKLGYTRTDDNGVLPNSNVKKNMVNFGGSYNISPKFTANANIQYSKINGKGRFGTGYSGRNVNQNFRQWYQRNVDIQDQKDAYFRNNLNVTWNWKDPSTAAGLVPIYTDNYYWTVYQNYETDWRNRIFGNVSLDYKLTDWLSIYGRMTLDTYNEFQDERVAVGSQGTPLYQRFDRSYEEINYDLMFNVDKQLSESFNLKGLLGTNIRKQEINTSFQTTSGGLVVPGLYSIANSRGTIPNAIETHQPKEVDGYFAGLTLTYKNFLSFDGSFRADKSSTLPEGDNFYPYGSASLSWVFSQHLLNIPWLSSGKLRVNWATVGNDAPWGSLADVYDQPTSFGGSTLFSLPGTKNNQNLVPERTNSYELGLDMSFFKNRLGFEVSFYNALSKDQIVPVAVSGATGYNTKFVNAGEVENKGVELTMFGTPIKTKDFSWNINLNWTRNRNEVLKLFDDGSGNPVTNLQLGSFQGGVSVNATLGQPYGTIQGKTYTYVNGQKVVDANGEYVATTSTNNVIGDVNPDWYGGIYNSFKYKNWNLGFLIDVKKGGEVWSLDMFYGLNYTGIYAESSGLNELGKSVRDNPASGGGVIYPGVYADGKPNTTRAWVDANALGLPAAAFAYDASYVKLREANLTYTIPSNVFGNKGVIKGIDLSLIGRNLWIIHKNLPYADPEENLSAGNIQGIQSGAYPTTRSIGFNVKLRL